MRPLAAPFLTSCLAAASCSASEPHPEAAAPTLAAPPTSAAAPGRASSTAAKTGRADVQAVAVQGDAGAYTFAVTVRSDDTGCDRYADWWEVLGEDGTLLYRRILGHSHVDEQPFTRSGGPVEVGGDTPLIVRAHLHPGGYGGVVLRGTANGGFEPAADVPLDFGAPVESAPPQPQGCAF